MGKVKLEEWRVKEIGKLLVQASELELNPEERHRLFFNISNLIDCFGLYETAEREIRKELGKFLQ